MTELTVLLFLLSISIFVLSFYRYYSEITWLSFFVSICSIAITVGDEALTLDETSVIVTLEFFIMLITGWKIFQNKTS